MGAFRVFPRVNLMMDHPIRVLRLLAALLLCAATGIRLAASSLLENSPFVPAAGPAAATVAEEKSQLELCSIVRIGDEIEFNLYDSAAKKSTWAKLGESGHDFLIKAYDAQGSTITIDFQGRTLSLPLRQAKIGTMSMASLPQPPMPAGPRPAAMPTIAMPPGRSNQTAGSAGPSAPRPTLTPEQVRTLEAAVQQRRAMRNAGRSPAAPAGPHQSSDR